MFFFFNMHISCLSPLNKVTFNWFWVAWARFHFPFAFPFKRLPRGLNFQKNISWQCQNEVAFTRLVSKGTSNGHWRKGLRSADSWCFLDFKRLKATRKVAVLNDSLYLYFSLRLSSPNCLLIDKHVSDRRMDGAKVPQQCSLPKGSLFNGKYT